MISLRILATKVSKYKPDRKFARIFASRQVTSN